MQQLPLEHVVVFLSSMVRSDAQVIRAAVLPGLMVHWGKKGVSVWGHPTLPPACWAFLDKWFYLSDLHWSRLEKRNPYLIFTCLGW